LTEKKCSRVPFRKKSRKRKTVYLGSPGADVFLYNSEEVGRKTIFRGGAGVLKVWESGLKAVGLAERRKFFASEDITKARKLLLEWAEKRGGPLGRKVI